MNIEEIGCYLLNKRKEKGITQNALADLLNVSHQAVSRWERGENLPDVMKLVELGKLYGVSVDYILKQGDNDTIQVENIVSDKDKNYLIFTVLNISFSFIGIMLFYILVLNGLRLGWGILFHYIIAMGSSQFFIIPFILNSNRSRRVFSLFRINIVVSAVLLLYPLISMFFWSYGYLSLITLLIDLVLGYVIYYVLILVEEKTYSVKIKSKYVFTNYISFKRIREIASAALIVILFVMVIGFNGILLLGITTFLSVAILYRIVRNFNFVSLFQFIVYSMTLFTLFWWNSINGISDESYLEYLVGLDETLITIITLSLALIILTLIIKWARFRESYAKYKILNFQLLSLNFILIVVYHLLRPQMYINRITETINGTQTITTNYIYEFSLSNSFYVMFFATSTFALLIVYDELKKLETN